MSTTRWFLCLALAVSGFLGIGSLSAAPNADELALVQKYRDMQFDVTGLKSIQTSGDYQLYELPGKVYVWQNKDGYQTANLPPVEFNPTKQIKCFSLKHMISIVFN